MAESTQPTPNLSTSTDSQQPLAGGSANQPLLPPHPALAVADLKNIQGDVIVGLPKKAQKFFFFTIADVDTFRKRLVSVIPLITTCLQTYENRQAIRKRPRKEDRLHMSGVNIAFSWRGLQKIDKDLFQGGASKDPQLFEKGMRATRQSLRDNPDNWDPKNWELFDPALDKKQGFDVAPDGAGQIDGVFNIAGEEGPRVESEWAKVAATLGDSINQAFVLNGAVRKGPEAGHEHFGYMDGISQPFILGTEDLLGPSLPGQGEVEPGVILLGRKGDKIESQGPSPAADLPEQERFAWQKDGTFMAFRYLRQKVPEFDNFLARAASVDPRVSKDLLGARMVGRWKSGAPLDIAPFQDDRSLAANKDENNNFQFEDNDSITSNPHSRCPFAAHIRKTRPRKDLDPKFMDFERVLRRGIPYGPGLDPKGSESKVSKADRGLLFVSYQSHLSRGFELMQKTWANNPDFIFRKDPNPGLDPIIGQSHADPTETDVTKQGAKLRQSTGLFSANAKDGTNEKDETTGVAGFKLGDKGAPKDADGTDKDELGEEQGEAKHEWVESRGGEYFFVPSLSSLLQYIAL
ncbi:Peroxidase 2 [Cyphellophora attinorum]|uniref:Peroxidase 2 n=1 Tax=Cyphellophora attinorum TaxID=1664694 RepID=A0A0N1HM61_9EURO|nr:Peroxidase 2 [Phialophora attinorum]KPI35787.1 Peroxidase 2 [Phialophora attinorum]